VLVATFAGPMDRPGPSPSSSKIFFPLMPLEPGQPAPDFAAPDQDGNLVQLQDFRGQRVALYFYPKDDTPGCTAQACNLRDHRDELLAQNIQVIGVSVDGEASHQKFALKYELPFPLLADPDKKIVEAYGVWQEKKNYGKTYMGTVRTTFLIDAAGIIEKIIKRPDTKEHAAQLLK
jgi:peroxiredoxin Q/BCP